MTAEEIAKISQERTLSDAELIKDGATYVANPKDPSRPRLEVTKAQMAEMSELQSEYQQKVEEISKKIDGLTTYGIVELFKIAQDPLSVLGVDKKLAETEGVKSALSRIKEKAKAKLAEFAKIYQNQTDLFVGQIENASNLKELADAILWPDDISKIGNYDVRKIIRDRINSNTVPYPANNPQDRPYLPILSHSEESDPFMKKMLDDIMKAYQKKLKEMS